MKHSFLMTKPDDWHLHLRDGEVLAHTVKATAKHFSRALVMPNLKPALTGLDALLAYRNRILNHLPQGLSFEPMMTFYLNEQVSPDDLVKAKNHSFIVGAKFYPAGATTNSEAGADSILALYPLLDIMQEQNLVLQMHGEVTHGDIFDRESQFVSTIVPKLLKDFPRLRLVLEHITTKTAVEAVINGPERLAATITPHHLWYNRNHMLAGGIKPHYYCLPILKRDKDQQALIEAATSGHPRFFAGTDSAPHAISQKESACGCAGIYSAPYALPLYAEIFDKANRLDYLNHFCSVFGADFYQKPHNNSSIELKREPLTVPDILPFGQDKVVPMAHGQTLGWSVHEAI